MSDLDDAIARLERAVARLEAVADPAKRAAENEQMAEVATAIGGRIDAALARLARLLERED